MWYGHFKIYSNIFYGNLHTNLKLRKTLQDPQQKITHLNSLLFVYSCAFGCTPNLFFAFLTKYSLKHFLKAQYYMLGKTTFVIFIFYPQVRLP